MSHAKHEITLQIHPAQTYQTVQGFGASGAWWAQVIGGWRDDHRQQVINLLFSPTTGIGLTLFRYNIGGGESAVPDPWRRSESLATSAGYDWSRDAAARWVLRAACAAGVRDVVIFANSPPEHLTISGRASGNPGGGSNLQPDRYDDFARYLVDVARHLIKVEGIPVRWISPINEPQWDWQPSKGQEGCHYEPDEIVEVLLALQRAIDQTGLAVTISAIEAGEWGSASRYAQPILAQPALAKALPHFAVHSYWSSPADKQAFVGFMQQHHPHVPLWMSEWTEMQQGRDAGMASALVLANTVHDDLILGNVTTWQYWIAVSKYDFRDGLIYTNEATEDIEETKRLWTLGNYSRFVRPGAVRVHVDGAGDAVKVSAYAEETTGTLTLLAINNSPESQMVRLPGVGAAFGSVSLHETSVAHNLARVYDGAVLDRYSLAASSVTTFVFLSTNGRSGLTLK